MTRGAAGPAKLRTLPGVPLIVTLLLGACTPDGPSTYVMALTATDAPALVEAIDAYVVQCLPGQPAVLIAAPAEEREIAPALRQRLAGQGFAVAALPAAHTHTIGYAVSPFEDGVLVQVFVDGRRAARVYGRDGAGALRPKGPYMAQQAVS